MAQMEKVLNGMTRHLDFQILDRGVGELKGTALSYYAKTNSLGVVLPSNSPGVHSLWVPSVPLKIPLILKPGSAEPWTPYRLAQAMIQAGCPPAAFSYYASGSCRWRGNLAAMRPGNGFWGYRFYQPLEK